MDSRYTRIVPLLLTALLALARPGAWAQAYPNRPIHMMPPFPAGGYELPTRRIGAEMARTVRGPTIVENEASANANIGSESAARSAPGDDTALMGGNGPISLNVDLYPQLAYHPIQDFATISPVATQPNLLASHRKVAVKSVAELFRAMGTHTSPSTEGQTP